MPLRNGTFRPDGKAAAKGASLEFQGALMAMCSYLCPNTGQQVHARVPAKRQPTMRNGPSVTAVTCPACVHLHFLNPATGKVVLSAREFARLTFEAVRP
jgi:hypothetical protein